jgi:hypothetical protein
MASEKANKLSHRGLSPGFLGARRHGVCGRGGGRQPTVGLLEREELDSPELICVSGSKNAAPKEAKKEGCIVKLTYGGKESSQNEHDLDQTHLESLYGS